VKCNDTGGLDDLLPEPAAPTPESNPTETGAT
jgi:hypothetical protein